MKQQFNDTYLTPTGKGNGQPQLAREQRVPNSSKYDSTLSFAAEVKETFTKVTKNALFFLRSQRKELLA